ncbi:MAG: DUF1189 domain-containing protein [Candidatus Omnitrophica bacterium]|nr:DUF1189 domain-containing protein [Candidatus Omnitrophota bacterium]
MSDTAGFKGIINSINPRFYPQIAAQSLGKSFLYLLFLVLIVSLLLSTRYLFQFKSTFLKFTDEIFMNPQETFLIELPEIVIDEGKVNSEAPQPLVIDKKEYVFILDTTGTITALTDYENGMLLTKDKFLIKTTRSKASSAETNEFDLAKLRISPIIIQPGDEDKGELLNIIFGEKVFSATRANVLKFGRTAGLVLAPFLLLFVFGLTLVGRIVQVLFFSPISILMNNINKTGLAYRQLINIGIYAMTLPTAISTLAIVIFGGDRNGILPVLLFFQYMIIYTVYLSLAVKQCKSSAPTGVAP